MVKKYFNVFLILLIIVAVFIFIVYSQIFERFSTSNIESTLRVNIKKNVTTIINKNEPRIFCLIMTSPVNFKDKVNKKINEKHFWKIYYFYNYQGTGSS